MKKFSIALVVAAVLDEPATGLLGEALKAFSPDRLPIGGGRREEVS